MNMTRNGLGKAPQTPKGTVVNHPLKVLCKVNKENLRAPDQKYRESDDRSEISYFILFHQKYPFGKLFSKIIINSPSAFRFFQKLEKFKIRLEAPLRPPETRENCAFFASSYAIMEIVPVLPFGS